MQSTESRRSLGQQWNGPYAAVQALEAAGNLPDRPFRHEINWGVRSKSFKRVFVYFCSIRINKDVK